MGSKAVGYEYHGRVPLVVVGLACGTAVVAVLAVLHEEVLRDERRYESLFIDTLIAGPEWIAEKGQERMLEGKVEGAGGAIELFEVAVRRDPGSPYRWCDLGEALAAAGRRDRGRYCIQRAVELGPRVPPILMRAANYYFAAGEARRALPYTARVLGLVADYDEAIFLSYERMGLSVAEVLEAGVPEGRRAGQAYLRHVVGGAGLEDVERAWEWGAGRGLADNRLTDEYARRLLKERQYEAAARVWGSHAQPREAGYGESNCVYNGSFEREPSGALFDWNISQTAGVEAAREAGTAAAGKYSLRIRFEGNENLSYNHVMQRAVVRPGEYRFAARVRAEDISTDEGVGFRVFDAEGPQRLDARTEKVTGSTEWRRVERVFRVPEGTRLVEVQVVREPSQKFDNKIRGTVWIDEVELRRARE